MAGDLANLIDELVDPPREPEDNWYERLQDILESETP